MSSVFRTRFIQWMPCDQLQRSMTSLFTPGDICFDLLWGRRCIQLREKAMPGDAVWHACGESSRRTCVQIFPSNSQNEKSYSTSKLPGRRAPQCSVRPCTLNKWFTIGNPTVGDWWEKRRYFGGFSGLEIPEHRFRCSPRSPTSLSVIYK